jgi:hypothetical protein
LIGANANFTADSVSNVWAGGNVTAASNVGGLIGVNGQQGSVSLAYATGNVTGDVGGGLIGANFGTVDQVYATGAVTSAHAGGLIASNSGSLSNAYWDVHTTGQASAASGGVLTNVGSVDSSTGSAYDQASYANFDFSNWIMIEGETRPALRSEQWNIGGKYVVLNAHQLQLMALDPTADYEIPDSGFVIDASETSRASGVWNPVNGFVPVGGNGRPEFTGSFNGHGATITNLKIHLVNPTPNSDHTGTLTDNGHVGLFGTIGDTGSVQNLNLANVQASGGDAMDVGTLAGWSYGTVSNVNASGTVTSGSKTAGGSRANAGGLVAVIEEGAIISDSSSSASAAVGTSSNAGGLVGAMVYGGAITNSHASGVVTAGDNVAGGYGNSPFAGGLVGLTYDAIGTGGGASTIDQSYATGNVTAGKGAFAGGLVGFTGAISPNAGGTLVERSYATGNAQAGDSLAPNTPSAVYSEAGGLVGDLGTIGDGISESYATGNATLGHWGSGGGLVGYSIGTIANSYSTGSTVGAGNNSVGGFVGNSDAQGTITNAYATGSAAAPNSWVGGFSGSNLGSISGAYWDKQTSGLANAFGNPASTGTATGLTTAQTATASSFAGFTFDGVPGGSGWVIVDTDGTLNNASGASGGTRPMLEMEFSNTITNAHQLQLMAMILGGNYTLADDIDLSAVTKTNDVWMPSAGFVPIGSSTNHFTGRFDGQGHAISNVFINEPKTDYVGLFGYVDTSGSVSNVNIANGTVQGADYVGSLAGQNDGSIFLASSAADVTGTDSGDGSTGYAIGGLVGANSGSINVSHASGKVVGFGVVGGLAGADFANGMRQPVISNSYATGDVSSNATSNEIANFDGADGLGGLVGQAAITTTGGTNYGLLPLLSFDYATGNVSGAIFVGGLAGDMNAGQILNSHATGSVTEVAGGLGYEGGLLGSAGDQADVATVVGNSYATGTVTGGTR